MDKMNHDFDQKIYLASSNEAIPVFFDGNTNIDEEDDNGNGNKVRTGPFCVLVKLRTDSGSKGRVQRLGFKF